MYLFYGANPPKTSPMGLKKSNPLGIYTDNSSILENKGFQPIKEKFKLLHFARKLLPKERTAHCFYSRISKEDGVDVYLNKLRNKANYGNVVRCGNPWGCPVCASIISEGRKNEVKKAMDWWKSQGGQVLLMTITVPHYSTTDIKSLKTGIKKSYGYLMKGTRASQDLFKRFGIAHYISAFEVTHGKNGFHPHYHILLFTNTSENQSVMRQAFYDVWVSCCDKSGLDKPSFKHGLDIRDGHHASRYVSKWGLEHEITKSHMKKGKNDSKTPFDLLRDFAETSNENSGKLFAIYYLAFKGSRQLNWSRGLKKLSNTVEQTDAEIVNETDNLAELMFKLDIELWQPIRKQGKQGELLLKVQEDHTLKTAMNFVRECLSFQSPEIAEAPVFLANHNDLFGDQL